MHDRTTLNLPSLNSRTAMRGELERLTAEFLARGGRIQAAAPLGGGGQWPVPKGAPSAPQGVRLRASRAKKPDERKRWTPEREQLLTEKFQAGTPVDEIAALFGVSESLIRLKASELGLRRPAAPAPAPVAVKPRKIRRSPWTPERTHILTSNYGVMDTAMLAAKLGIAKGSVYAKARELGLKCYGRSA